MTEKQQTQIDKWQIKLWHALETGKGPYANVSAKNLHLKIELCNLLSYGTPQAIAKTYNKIDNNDMIPEYVSKLVIKALR